MAKLRLPENSLFAVLMRSPWWVSALLALGVFAAMRLVLADMYAFAGGLPFAAIAVVVAWRQLRAPSGKRIVAGLEAVRAMSWEEFTGTLEQGFRREGYTVKRVQGAADFELEKQGLVSLVCARRWKAARAGVEPLRELVEAAQRRHAGKCVYVCAGELTANARKYAVEKNVRLVEGVGLLALAQHSE